MLNLIREKKFLVGIFLTSLLVLSGFSLVRAASNSISMQVGDILRIQCSGGKISTSRNLFTGILNVYCTAKTRSTPTPIIPTTNPTTIPGISVTPTSSPNPTPNPNEQMVGKCGESMDEWHPPVVNGCATGHEHGDPPPSWIYAAGYNPMFSGMHSTSGIENMIKHTSMKGYSVTFNGMDIYLIYHFASNPQERFGSYHSYQLWMRPSNDNDPTHVSHLQGWSYSGNPLSENDRCLRRNPPLPCESTRPIILVTDQTSFDQGITCEQWYADTAPWSIDFGITICGSTTFYNRERELSGDPNSLTGVFDQSTWQKTGDLGLTRRLELAWYSAPGSVDPNRGNPPKDRVFWATQFGEIVSGPSDPRCQPSATTIGKDGKTYQNKCLEQYISSAARYIQFPGNAVQKTYNGNGVTIPN